MINLGIYETNDGKCYECHFIPGDNMVQAVGPLPNDGVRACGVAYEAFAESKEDAIKKIQEFIKQ